MIPTSLLLTPRFIFIIQGLESFHDFPPFDDYMNMCSKIQLGFDWEDEEIERNP